MGIELWALKLLSIEGIGHKRHVRVSAHAREVARALHDGLRGPGCWPCSVAQLVMGGHSYRKLRNLTRPYKAFCGLKRPPLEKSFKCLEDINKIANIQWF